MTTRDTDAAYTTLVLDALPIVGDLASDAGSLLDDTAWLFDLDDNLAVAAVADLAARLTRLEEDLAFTRTVLDPSTVVSSVRDHLVDVLDDRLAALGAVALAPTRVDATLAHVDTTGTAVAETLTEVRAALELD